MNNCNFQIYHAALISGPKHVKTTGGYFHMANVFFRKGQTETAHNIYSEVVNIWSEMLKSVVKLEEPQPESTLTSFVDKSAEEGEMLGKSS